MKPWILRAVLIAGSVLLAVAGLEAGLRMTGFRPVREEGMEFMDTANARYGWAYRPGSTFASDGRPEFAVDVAINSKALRDREYPYERVDGTHRIVVLGDSFSAAVEVPLEQAWHEVLERRLRAAGEAVEIINGGVAGWGTDQELLFYRHEGRKYAPNLVLLQFYNNDVSDNDLDAGDPTIRDEKPYFVLRGEGLQLMNFPYRGHYGGTGLGGLRVVQFVEHGRDAFLKLAQKRLEDTRCGASTRVPRQLMVFARDYPPVLDDAWQVTAALIRRLKAEVEAGGARLAVVYFPDRRQVLPGMWDTTLRCYPRAAAMAWDLDKPNRLLGEIAHQEGIPYLDLSAAFRREALRAPQGLYYRINRHFTSRGHELAAGEIAAWLAPQGFPSR